MGKFPMCFGADTTLILLRVAGIIGSYATGLYTCYKIMWDPTSIRWAIVFFYVTLFAVVIPSAELGLLKHPAIRQMSLFLTTFTGRALFYIFMGGLILDSYGYIPGVWMIATGVANILAQCCCSAKLKGKKPLPPV